MTTATPAVTPAGTPRWRQALFNLLFASFGYVAIRMVIAPVRIKLLTSLLTKEDYGLLTLVMLTVSFVTLISSLGSLEYMLRKIPGRETAFQYSVLRTIMTWFGLLAGFVGLAGAGLLIMWSPEKLGLSGSDIVACSVILILTVHLTQIVYFLMGRSAYAQSRMLMLFYADAWFLPLLIFMWFWNISVAFMLWLWVIWLLISVVVSRYLAPIKEVLRMPASRAQLKEILIFGVPLLPMIMGEWIFQLIDRYVLLSFTNLEALANFTLCFNIAWVGVSTGTSLLDVLITEFYKSRNRVASKEMKTLLAHAPLRSSFTMLLRYSLILTIPMVLALWIGRVPIIHLLSDPKFASAADIMMWVAPLPLLYMMVIISGRTLMAIDRGAVVGAATLAAGVIHLLISVAITPALAERGVALSGCIAYGVLAIYLGARAKLFAWINYTELRPFRLGLFALICAGGLHVTVNGLEGRHVWGLFAGSALCLGAMFALGLVRKSDLRQLMESMHAPARAEDNSHIEAEPFARD